MSERSGGQPEATLGRRLERQARDLVARYTRAADRVARLTREVSAPGRGLPLPAGSRRLRVEAALPEDQVNRYDPRNGGDRDGRVHGPGGGPAPATVMGSPASGQPQHPGQVGGAGPLPAAIRERVAPIVGGAAERVVVRADGPADEVARAHDAAAVTVGQEIAFRSGRFRSADPAGVGLLTHEVWHAAESARPGTSWRRSTPGGRAEEEARARAAGRAAETVYVGRSPSEVDAESGTGPWPAGPAHPLGIGYAGRSAGDLPTAGHDAPTAPDPLDLVDMPSRPDLRDLPSRPKLPSQPDPPSRPELLNLPDLANRPDLVNRPDMPRRPDPLGGVSQPSSWRWAVDPRTRHLPPPSASPRTPPLPGSPHAPHPLASPHTTHPSSAPQPLRASTGAPRPAPMPAAHRSQAGPAAHPMAAPEHEPEHGPGPFEPSGPAPTGSGRPSLDAALRDLRRQLRVEQERGA